MHSILVKDYMDANPHAVKNEFSVAKAALFLVKQQLSGAPVIDEKGILIGFVSEKDCLPEVLTDSFFCDESPSVETVMTKSVVTTTPETSIVELAQSMVAFTHHNYPVVENNKLVGLITRSRILKALIEVNDDCYLLQKNKPGKFCSEACSRDYPDLLR